jgi:hypothetical protein
MHLEFADLFGRRGRAPRRYWTFEIGHILPAITPANIGQIRAVDLLAARTLFDAKYRGGDE